MKRGGIDDIAAIDGEHNLKTKIAPFPHHNGITAAFFGNNEPAIANNQAGATFVRFGRATQSSPTPRLARPKPGPFFPRDRARHRANSCLVIVIDRGGGKGMIEIRAFKRDGSN